MIGVIFIVGLIFGSFYNVCIYRLPLNQSVIYPPSHCTSCNNRLQAIDLIPVFSFLLLKGRCRHCGEKISIEYMLIELFTGFMFALGYIKFGLTLYLLVYICLISLLIVITFIDLQHQIIPDSALIVALALGLIFTITNISTSFKEAILGMILGGGFFLAVAVLSQLILKKDGLGGGDIKLMGVIGLYLGWRLTVLSILLSIYSGGILGLILILTGIKKRGDYIPFGPFIAIGTAITMFFGNEIINWYVKGILGY